MMHDMRKTRSSLPGSFAWFSICCLILFLLSIPVFAAREGPRDPASSSFEEELLNRINRYRGKNGLQPLSFDEKCYSLATHHSRQMSREDRLHHDDFVERYSRSGCSLCVENVGWNFGTAGEQFEGWRKSNGHNKNMLQKRIRIAGISEVGAYVTFFACN